MKNFFLLFFAPLYAAKASVETEFKNLVQEICCFKKVKEEEFISQFQKIKKPPINQVFPTCIGSMTALLHAVIYRNFTSFLEKLLAMKNLDTTVPWCNVGSQSQINPIIFAIFFSRDTCVMKLLGAGVNLLYFEKKNAAHFTFSQYFPLSLSIIDDRLCFETLKALAQHTYKQILSLKCPPQELEACTAMLEVLLESTSHSLKKEIFTEILYHSSFPAFSHLSLLEMSIKKGNKDFVLFLLAHKKDFIFSTQVCPYGKTLLIKCIETKNPAIFSMLLKFLPEDYFESLDVFELNDLFNYALLCRDDMRKTLITLHLVLSLSPEKFAKYTPAQVKSILKLIKKYEVERFLKKQIKSIKEKWHCENLDEVLSHPTKKSGGTALSQKEARRTCKEISLSAAEWGHYPVFLEAQEIFNQFFPKCNLNSIKNEKGQTPLLVACNALKSGREEDFFFIVARLLLEGAEIDVQDTEGNTALHLIFDARSYTKHIAERLLNDGTIEKKNKRGQTPLHIACSSYNYEGVSLLLQWGANPYTLDENLYSTRYFIITHLHKEKKVSVLQALQRESVELRIIFLSYQAKKLLESDDLLGQEKIRKLILNHENLTLELANLVQTEKEAEEVLYLLVLPLAGNPLLTSYLSDATLKSLSKFEKKWNLSLKEIIEQSKEEKFCSREGVYKNFFRFKKSNYLNIDGKTPLSFAVTQKNKDEVALLLKATYEDKRKLEIGHSKDTEILKADIKPGMKKRKTMRRPDLSFCDVEGKTVFHHALEALSEALKSENRNEEAVIKEILLLLTEYGKSNLRSNMENAFYQKDFMSQKTPLELVRKLNDDALKKQFYLKSVL